VLRALRAQPIYDPKLGGPGPATRLEITGVDADLSTSNAKPIPIPLGKDNKYGSITLAPNAIAHLKASGSVGGNDAAGNSTAGKLEPITLARATAQDAHLLLGPAIVDTGQIEITGVKDAQLSFSGMFPTHFSGEIGKAVAKDIRWEIVKPAKKEAK